MPAKIPFFNYNWRKELWNILFVVGVFIGGIIASQFLSNPDEIIVNEHLKSELATYGIHDYSQIVPMDLFTWDNLFTLKGFVLMVVGGFLVGFGTRYAGGCTSGHAIMGLSNLQLTSLIATICFMMGGFFMANVLLPYILSL